MSKKDELRTALELDLWAYAQYINPTYAYGDIHREIFERMGNPERENNQLFLIPRDHLKSHCAATFASWLVAKDPATSILYITAGEDLGKLQMGAIKSIFEGDRFRYLWPDHFDPDEGRRDRWSSWAVNCDHPLRKEMGERDETIVVKTVKSSKTGRHPKHIIYDDVVVPENAYSSIGRREVAADMAQAVSLAQNDATMTAVGTRYHIEDQYNLWSESEIEVYDDNGVFQGTRSEWDIIEYSVEDAGDGTGAFLWPRTYSPKIKKWFGFDIRTLAIKRAGYFNNGERTQYFAQYYMKPDDPESLRLRPEDFSYYEAKFLTKVGDTWKYRGSRLNIVAAMDLAATDAASKTAKRADYTAIAILGIDEEGMIYVLDLHEFQTDKRKVYYDAINGLRDYWGFRRIYVEAEGGFLIAVEGIKEEIRQQGDNLVVEGVNAPRGISKFERHASIAEPRYLNGTIKHFKGGLVKKLEEQLIQVRPAHDDLLDAVCIAIEKLRPPRRLNNLFDGLEDTNVVNIANSRFGGVRR